jgi:hypothetical protein
MDLLERQDLPFYSAIASRLERHNAQQGHGAYALSARLMLSVITHFDQ